jgi:DNA-binding transcriptional MocR family regulator
MRDKLSSMIDLVWNFPLLEEQAVMWRVHLAAAMAEYDYEPVESQRPSFRTVDGSLRERAARWLGFAPERTWITCGGHHGTLNALLASGLAGERVAVEGTTYPGLLDQCKLTKTEVVACAIDDDGLIPESLRAACERSRTEGKPITGLLTMPTVQNPMGFVTPLARREEIVAIVRDFELKIIEDDAYGFMEAGAPPNYAVLAPERTFYVCGLAKSFSPAVRTGFLVAPESAEAAMVMSLKNTATGTDVLQNMAALAMCEDGTVDRVMEHKRTEGAVRNREARALLGASAAPGALCAWHVWVRPREGVDGHAVVAAMKKVDVMVSPGDACAAAPEYGRGLRLALGAEIKRERTLEGVARVAEYLRRT